MSLSIDEKKNKAVKSNELKNDNSNKKRVTATATTELRQKQSIQAIDSKYLQSKDKNEMKRDLKLIDKLEKMTNDEIGEMLCKYILDDETSQFLSCLKTIKLLATKETEENESKANNNEISLDYILNEGLFSSSKCPLIVIAVHKNNIEIVEALLSKENDYKVNILFP